MTELKPDTMLLMGNIHSTGECITMRSQMDDVDEVVNTLNRFIKAVGFDTDGLRLVLADDELLMTIEANQSDEEWARLNASGTTFLNKPNGK